MEYTFQKVQNGGIIKDGEVSSTRKIHGFSKNLADCVKSNLETKTVLLWFNSNSLTSDH
jgi:hypothetical protein